MTLKYKTALLSFAAIIALPAAAQARDQIRMVGSSTVYPFATVAAETFGQNTGSKTPIVEPTGTGGGFKLFCGGVGADYPDISNASRPIKTSEKELCAKNGVKDITELMIGYDGIVFANALGGPQVDLSKEQLFKAFARELPVDGKLVANPNQKWSDIDPSLPDQEIKVYGPPPTSGTRDAFVELVMEEACDKFPEIKAAHPDKKEYKKACGLLREDQKYIDAGEDDNLIITKLVSDPNAYGIFGYSFLEENTNKVQGAKIEGVAPTFDNIGSGKYGVSRSLFMYIKDAHVGVIPGLGEFAQEVVSDEAIGPDGYLVMKGLLPLETEKLKKAQMASSSLTSGSASPAEGSSPAR